MSDPITLVRQLSRATVFHTMKGDMSRDHRAAILYILHSGNLYGTERMALATLAGMTEYAVRVVIAPPPHGKASVAAAARMAGLDVGQFRTRWGLVRVLLPFFLRHRTIDVIGTGISQGFTCYLLSKLLSVRLRQLQVVHGGTMESHAYGRKRYLNLIPVRIIAVSDYVRTKLLEYGVRERTISTIDNFLTDADCNAIKPRAPYGNGTQIGEPIDSNRVRVTIVSRVDPVKRIDLLLDAVETGLLESFQFDIFGTGYDLDSLTARASGLANVRFHGFSADIPERLRHSDVLLHLCPIEPFGLVILEAFATRLCVVVADRGGAGQLVEHGINGLRFASDDAADLIRVLQELRVMSGTRIESLVSVAAERLRKDFGQASGVDRYRAAMSAVASP